MFLLPATGAAVNGATMHPFLALCQFGIAVDEEQSALYRQLITAVRPQDPGEWGPRFHELEAELDGLRKAARRVAPEVAQLTGMAVVEILRRVNTFADAVMKILLWQRDAPAPSAKERQELECSGKPNRAVEYFVRESGEMLNKWLPLKELLDIVDVPAGPGSNVKKMAGGEVEEINVQREEQWLTVSQAATASVCNSGIITRAVNCGELQSNGKQRRERRINPVDLVRWQLSRANKGDAAESDEQVTRLMNKHGRD